MKKKEARSKVKRDLNYCVLHGHKPTKAINDDTQIVKSFIKLIQKNQDNQLSVELPALLNKMKEQIPDLDFFTSKSM